VPVTIDLEAVTHYLLEIDQLKAVQRRSYTESGARLENSAEHSWHLAMACWSIARLAGLKLDEGKLLKLALIHDLGEIDAGDTFLYAAHRDNAHRAEREGVARLAQLTGNGVSELLELWDEQEHGNSPETRLLKVIDRLLPFLLNVASQGRTWREMNIRKSQVLNAHAFIEQKFPEIHRWIVQQVNHAVQQGWLQGD